MNLCICSEVFCLSDRLLNLFQHYQGSPVKILMKSHTSGCQASRKKDGFHLVSSDIGIFSPFHRNCPKICKISETEKRVIYILSSASPDEKVRDVSPLTASFPFHSCFCSCLWLGLGFESRVGPQNGSPPLTGLKTSCKMKVQVLWQFKGRNEFSTLVTFCHLNSLICCQRFSCKLHWFRVLTITLIITYCR